MKPPALRFYLWCRLPEGRDAASVARAALRDGVVLAPGDVFSSGRASGGAAQSTAVASARSSTGTIRGSSIWATFARAALRDGVVLAPGDVFSVSRSAGGFMRFNVAQMDRFLPV
jgi:DNA-binding transcriptional MocR family regulator